MAKFHPGLRGLPGLADRATRLGGSSHQSCKRDQIKMRDYTDRRVTTPTWGPPPPCKQTLSVPKVTSVSLATNRWPGRLIEVSKGWFSLATESES